MSSSQFTRRFWSKSGRYTIRVHIPYRVTFLKIGTLVRSTRIGYTDRVTDSEAKMRNVILEMRNVILVCFVSVGASAFTSIMAGTPFWSAMLYAWLSPSATLILFWIGEYIANTRYRPTIDVQYLQRGVCPCCKATGGLVEVTSETEGQRRVVCAPCSNAFALVVEDDHVVAHRLGETKVFPQ